MYIFTHILCSFLIRVHSKEQSRPRSLAILCEGYYRHSMLAGRKPTVVSLYGDLLDQLRLYNMNSNLHSQT